MNYYNISRATQGLVAYLEEWRAAERISGRAENRHRHDTRHFSREFAELAARVATENGCDAFLFDGPRSTPEFSFAVRYCAQAPALYITASHNPPHDNGYKVYFYDGARWWSPMPAASSRR